MVASDIAATEHYLHRVTFGHLAQRLDLRESGLIAAMHHLAKLFKPVSDQLILDYRPAQRDSTRG